jgi:ATP-dependent helicase/DNAse subunit B
MPLKLVLGPANAAKAGEVLGAFAGAARRGALLVVPTAADADHYARELSARSTLLGRVLTFPGLAAEIASRAGCAAAPLSTLQRERVLARALAVAPLRVLGRARGTRGMLAACGELIAELARELIDPQRFARALRRWSAEDPGRRAAYASELASIYSAYVRELDRIGRLDRELFAWRALDALRAAPGRWGRAPVFFYGFDDLLGIERDAIETLACRVGVEVVVSLTYEPGRTALAARARSVEELRSFAAEVVQLPASDAHYAPASRRALHQLERRLFEPAGERVDAGQALAVLEAGGERAEAELIGAEVLELLAAGVPAEQVAIVCRSLRRSGPLLASVLGRYGVPACGEWTAPLAQAALARSLLALARCAQPDDSGRAADLIAYLRTPGVLERPELADRLEREIRRRGIRGAEQARRALGLELPELARLREAADPAAALLEHGRALLAAPYRRRAALLDRWAELDARALARLAAAAEELAALGERLRLEQLPELLESLELTVGAPLRPGAVLLCEPLAIRARRFRAVLICGLCEGELPAAGGGDPLLSDERRRELALSSGLRLEPREDRLDAERYLFYSVASRATERLVLSYRSSDEEGSVVLPSPFLADVAALFNEGLLERRRRRLLADVVWPAELAPTAHERARSRAAQAGRAAAVLSTGGNDEIRLSERALAHVRHRELISGGALERFADCPVRWLVEAQLEPGTLDPDSEALLRGSYMHAVLERLLRALGEPLDASSLPRAQRLLRAILAERAGEGERAAGAVPDRAAVGAGGPAQPTARAPSIGIGRTPRVRAAMLLAIEADLRRYLEQEAASGCAFRPSQLELRFGFEGEEGSLPPLTLAAGSESVRLRGVIDRIDIDPGTHAAIVRDYKAGSARPEHQGARWLAERRLQVALYMLAVRRLLGLDPVAGLYQPLGGGDLRPRGIYLRGAAVGGAAVPTDARERSQLDEQLGAAERLAVALAAQLRAGRLVRCPTRCSRAGCRYPGICRGD